MLQYVVAVVVLVATWFWRVSRPPKLPPGPLSFPIVKNFPALSGDPNFTAVLSRLHRKHGKIFSLSLVGDGVWDVWVQGYDVIKELLNDQRFFGRVVYGPLLDLQMEKGVGWCTGEVWRHKRKVMAHVMRSLGVGKSVFAAGVEFETEKLLNYLKENIDKPCHVQVCHPGT